MCGRQALLASYVKGGDLVAGVAAGGAAAEGAGAGAGAGAGSLGSVSAPPKVPFS